MKSWLPNIATLAAVAMLTAYVHTQFAYRSEVLRIYDKIEIIRTEVATIKTHLLNRPSRLEIHRLESNLHKSVTPKSLDNSKDRIVASIDSILFPHL